MSLLPTSLKAAAPSWSRSAPDLISQGMRSEADLASLVGVRREPTTRLPSARMQPSSLEMAFGAGPAQRWVFLKLEVGGLTQEVQFWESAKKKSQRNPTSFFAVCPLQTDWGRALQAGICWTSLLQNTLFSSPYLCFSIKPLPAL